MSFKVPSGHTLPQKSTLVSATYPISEPKITLLKFLEGQSKTGHKSQTKNGTVYGHRNITKNTEGIATKKNAYFTILKKSSFLDFVVFSANISPCKLKLS